MSNSRFNNSVGTQSLFACHLREYIGENVIVFTESGGASGCGFEGILLAVTCDYIRLATSQGLSPSNPLSETICGDFDGFDRNNGTSCCSRNNNNYDNGRKSRLGSVCDIPISQIVAFCHNAV